MSRVLVTGAGGFIGRSTLAPLLAAGYDVHAVTSRRAPAGLVSVGPPPPAARARARASVRPAAAPIAVGAPEEALREMAPAVRWHHADLLAPESAAALMHELRPSHLLHAAWYMQPGSLWSADQNLDWVQASLRLLRAFGEVQGRRVVITGSCTEYAWEGDTHCVEDAPAAAGEDRGAGASAVPAGRVAPPTRVIPATLYGTAKHALHVVAEHWAPLRGVSLAWARIFFAYGPHEHPDRLASGVARALLRGEEARCTSGTQVRDYLYTPDLGRALTALLGSEAIGAVNVASGEPARVADLVMAIAAAAGRPELVRLGALPQRSHDPERLTADVRRLREEVGWRPSIGLREGAARTVDWWREAEGLGPAPRPQNGATSFEIQPEGDR